MPSTMHRLILVTALSLALLATAGPAWAAHGPAPAADADAPQAPALANPGFECNQGYSPQPGIRGLVPNGWTAVLMNSACAPAPSSPKGAPATGANRLV